MDALALKQARVPLGERVRQPVAELAHKSAFDGYVRKGETALSALEPKAMSVGIQSGRRLPGSGGGGSASIGELEDGFADPLHRGRAAGVGGGLQDAFATTGSARAGWARRRRGRDNTPLLAELCSRRWNFMPCRRRRRRCSTTARSTSTSGSRRKCAGLRRAGRHGLRDRRWRQ